MRRLANVYLVLFLLDAGLSLTDELASLLGAPLGLLAVSRHLVAVPVVLLSLVVYALLGMDRRLPKRIFLPLTLYVFWCSMGLWPLLGMVSRQSLVLAASVGQVAVGGIALAMVRNAYGRNMLPAGAFQGPGFAWRNTLVFSAVNLVLLPVILVFSLLAAAGCYLDQQTAGFMRVSPFGVYTSERSYQRDGQTVRLVAMMHVAREGYYEELVDTLPAGSTIVLAEGVTDEQQLLKNRFNYGRLAKLVGLRSQETMQLEGNPVALEDLEPAVAGERDATQPDIVRADLDVADFEPQTVAFLDVLARTLLSDEPLAQGLLAYMEWAQRHGTPEVYAGVMNDILHKRNALVIDTLQRSVKRYDTVVVPWGGMHMPAIEAAVLDEGFVLGDKQERVLFSFSSLPLLTMWHEFSSPTGTPPAAAE